MIKVPAYPKGTVIGPCVCGSWPGSACHRCKMIVPKPAELFRAWSWLLPLRGAGDYKQCSDGAYRHVMHPERRFAVV